MVRHCKGHRTHIIHTLWHYYTPLRIYKGPGSGSLCSIEHCIHSLYIPLEKCPGRVYDHQKGIGEKALSSPLLIPERGDTKLQVFIDSILL